jgi:hypothetical protein
MIASLNSDIVFPSQQVNKKNSRHLPGTRVVLSRTVLQEIEGLVQCFRSQVRNSVAVANWLQQRYKITPEQLPWQNLLQTSPVLTFRFKASELAFNVFTHTLIRKSYYLHRQAQILPQTQLLQVNHQNIPLSRLEQELSVVLEDLHPRDYLATLLQQKQAGAESKLAG